MFLCRYFVTCNYLRQCCGSDPVFIRIKILKKNNFRQFFYISYQFKNMFQECQQSGSCLFSFHNLEKNCLQILIFTVHTRSAYDVLKGPTRIHSKKVRIRNTACWYLYQMCHVGFFFFKLKNLLGCQRFCSFLGVGTAL